MQWSFLLGEQVHLRSAPIEVLILFPSLSLNVNDKGPDCPTMNNVILDATSNAFNIYIGILVRYGCERDIFITADYYVFLYYDYLLTVYHNNTLLIKYNSYLVLILNV
jgi:hypothetical protein